MSNTDWQATLQAFLASNPELPQGEEQTTTQQESKPSQPRLDIVLEKKGRAGKMATIVVGFTCDDAELARIAGKMKSKLGAGGSARAGEILIQGDRRNDVLQFLIAAGYKARII